MEVVMLYRTLVGRLGYHVRTSSAPLEALTMVETENFDLIITDLKMPKMGGIEFIKKVREMGSTAKVIVITGYPTLKDAQEFNRLDVFKCLQKPVLLRTIEETIAAALGSNEVVAQGVTA
jgi:DNA-binding NtrC family response regulator